MNNWDKKFMSLATFISGWSKDESKQNGTVIVNDDNIVLSQGYNGLPVGCNDNKPSRQERPKKYMYFEHAERNAIYHAAKIGVALKGTRMYATMFPCSDCARGIIQSGITKVIAPKPDIEHERWGEHFTASIEMLKEAGVEIKYNNEDE